MISPFFALNPAETTALSAFLSKYFGADFTPKNLSKAEQKALNELVEEVVRRATTTRYLLGSAIDYVLMAQKLAVADVEARIFRPVLTVEALFQRYQLVTERNGKKANTLTLRFGDTTEAGMRGFEEKVVDWFRGLNRNYPSAYVYNTGQWAKSTDLLVRCFQLSTDGRYQLCIQLLRAGLQTLFPAGRATGRQVVQRAIFTDLLRGFPRSAPGENGGMILQALAYGFFYADRQHLEFAVDKVRTGSSRQNRIGDVDGYYGLDLALTVEVKDLELTVDSLDRQLAVFRDKVSREPGATAIVVTAGITPDALSALSTGTITILTVEALMQITETWDWHKQNRAVHAVLHYVAHIEQHPQAVERVLTFIKTLDPTHTSLLHWQPTTLDAPESAVGA